MKNIAIIGAGVAGLRAALELSQTHQTTIFEKSPSVGGRVATRRFAEGFVNHGAIAFDGTQRVLALDPQAAQFAGLFAFDAEATALPKALRDELLTSTTVKFEFKTRVAAVSESGTVTLDDGRALFFDGVLLTAPVPQIRELLKRDLFPAVSYSKCILFIGVRAGEVVRLELPQEWAEKHFEESDEELRRLASEKTGEDLSQLDVKKWRYARVLTGNENVFVRQGEKLLLAGDAFDPEGIFDLSAAWLSGLGAAKAMMR